MERVLQWLDDCEDLAFCLPLVWWRARAWTLVGLLTALTVLLAT